MVDLQPAALVVVTVTIFGEVEPHIIAIDDPVPVTGVPPVTIQV